MHLFFSLASPSALRRTSSASRRRFLSVCVPTGLLAAVVGLSVTASPDAALDTGEPAAVRSVTRSAVPALRTRERGHTI
ncbi:MAG: hypothetical protein V4671_07100 [Armatimonadota bacterium]